MVTKLGFPRKTVTYFRRLCDIKYLYPFFLCYIIRKTNHEKREDNMVKKGYSSQLTNEIEKHIDSRLVEYHKEMCLKNKNFAIDFSEILKITIENQLKNEMDSQKLKALFRNKKKAMGQKKKRQYESCVRMVESRAWENDDIERYCFKDIATNYKYLSKQQWNALYSKPFDELQQERLENIKKWAGDDKSLMIEYPGLEKKTPKAIFNNFQADLVINILSILKELYDFNLDRLTFSMMNDLSDKALFGISKEKITYAPEEKKGLQMIFSSENGKDRSVVTFDEEAFSGKDYLRGFDFKDQELLSYLIKLMLSQEGTQYPIVKSIASITRAINKDPNAVLGGKNYEDTINRLKKMSHANVDYYRNDEYLGTLHLLQIEVVPDKQLVSIWPSDYLLSQLEQNRITQMPAEQRNELERDVSKLLYMTFMTQRVKAYKKIRKLDIKNEGGTVVYEYNHFLRFVNFGKMTKPEIIAEILAALEEYKSKKIFIEDFKYVSINQTFAVNFLPLTDIEIQDISYYFGDEFNDRLTDSDNIIGQLTMFDYIED